jgi:hypothetical protein
VIECPSCHALNPDSESACLVCHSSLPSASPQASTPLLGMTSCPAGHPVDPSWDSCPLCEHLRALNIPSATSPGVELPRGRPATREESKAPLPSEKSTSMLARKVADNIMQGRSHWLLAPMILAVCIVVALPFLIPSIRFGSVPEPALPAVSTPTPTPRGISSLQEATSASAGQVPPLLKSLADNSAETPAANPPRASEPVPKPTPERATPTAPVLRPSQVPRQTETPSEPQPSLVQNPTPTHEEGVSGPIERSELPSNSENSVERFQQMEELVIGVKNLSDQARQAYEQEGRNDELAESLKEFQNAATGIRRTFRRATGTGLWGKINIFKRKDSGSRQADAEALSLKIKELEQKGGEIDRLMKSNPPSANTLAIWREVHSNLERLKSFL